VPFAFQKVSCTAHIRLDDDLFVPGSRTTKHVWVLVAFYYDKKPRACVMKGRRRAVTRQKILYSSFHTSRTDILLYCFAFYPRIYRWVSYRDVIRSSFPGPRTTMHPMVLFLVYRRNICVCEEGKWKIFVQTIETTERELMAFIYVCRIAAPSTMYHRHHYHEMQSTIT
jgi:hypothetical protein